MRESFFTIINAIKNPRLLRRGFSLKLGVSVNSYLKEPSEAPFNKLLDKGSPPFIPRELYPRLRLPWRLHACYYIYIESILFGF